MIFAPHLDLLECFLKFSSFEWCRRCADTQNHHLTLSLASLFRPGYPFVQSTGHHHHSSLQASSWRQTPHLYDCWWRNWEGLPTMRLHSKTVRHRGPRHIGLGAQLFVTGSILHSFGCVVWISLESSFCLDSEEDLTGLEKLVSC